MPVISRRVAPLTGALQVKVLRKSGVKGHSPGPDAAATVSVDTRHKYLESPETPTPPPLLNLFVYLQSTGKCDSSCVSGQLL